MDDHRRDPFENARAPKRAPRLFGAVLALLLFAGLLFGGAVAAIAGASSYIGGFMPNPKPLATTVPKNGDVNPYGIVTVQHTVGSLKQGDLLISNFNDKKNLQGTGTTIVELPPGGKSGKAGTATVFAKINAKHLPGPCPGGIGLTTALAETQGGWVIVGSLPTTNGKPKTAKAGCLLILNSSGKVVKTISGSPINGPWDMTADEHGSTTTLYVTNVLNGTVAAKGKVVKKGTVVRIALKTAGNSTPTVMSEKVIATGFPERTDPSALVIGPTGDALASNGTLYVADTLKNRIAAIPNATTLTTRVTKGGKTVSRGMPLNVPLGMFLAPNGHILTANGGDGNIVETTPAGKQVATVSADKAGAGVLFGLTISPSVTGVYFVDDGDNSLRLLKP